MREFGGSADREARAKRFDATTPASPFPASIAAKQNASTQGCIKYVQRMCEIGVLALMPRGWERRAGRFSTPPVTPQRHGKKASLAKKRRHCSALLLQLMLGEDCLSS